MTDTHSALRGKRDIKQAQEKQIEPQYTIALAGNPNVGKSTVFNALTGLRQHTGNWPGKTVESARGACKYGDTSLLLVDLPGTYSLLAHSAEEEVAREFLCFGGADAAVVVCDATCLERNLNLVLQTMEITNRVVVLVNLMDEAAKKGIRVDLAALGRELGVPVVGAAARSGQGLQTLLEKTMAVAAGTLRTTPRLPAYGKEVEAAITALENKLAGLRTQPRWAALRLLEGEEALLRSLEDHEKRNLRKELGPELSALRAQLADEGLQDRLVRGLYRRAEEIAAACVSVKDVSYQNRQLRADRFLTDRRTGTAVMLLMLALVFYITIAGANLPSEGLSYLFGILLDWVEGAFAYLHAPDWLTGLLVRGGLRVLFWVVAVMLPPMAIFFPLFTLLEDVGYLPRVAFNLDGAFKRCKACGKQALSMCMGFGCNAAGIVGCRIIDSPRERLIAILTNNLVPCNGRFPALIALMTMFFAGSGSPLATTALCALMLTGLIVLGVLLTFWTSRLLSSTLLKGVPSSFILELPPYRRPQIGRVIVRSIFDRTLFVLGRAAAVALPAGLAIWTLANVRLGGESLLFYMTRFLDPFARLLGLDGVILMAFVLALPANEIMLPLVLLGYLSGGTLSDIGSLDSFRQLLVQHGWTAATAVCTMLFTLVHWPCSTALISIHKETGSWKWTALGFAIPTVLGMALCFLTASVFRLFGL